MITFKGGENLPNKYVENVVAMFRRQGLAPKYDRPGIYCIRLDNQMIYIGKSTNMLHRIASHYVGVKEESEKKYRLLAQMQREGHTIGFDVLYYAGSTGHDDINDEIGHMEGVYIRQYRPTLNTQIPKEEDWRKFEIKQIATENELRRLLSK